MRITLFGFILLAAPAALGQAGPLASGPAAPGQPLPAFTQSQSFAVSAPVQSGIMSFQPAQSLLPQQQPLSLAMIGPPPRNGAAEPIPTRWPHAKFEPIPTRWPHLKLLPVDGAAAQASSGGGNAAASLRSAPK